MYFHTQPEREKSGKTNQEDAPVQWETPEIVKLKELESLPKLLELFIILLSKSIKSILGILCCKLVLLVLQEDRMGQNFSNPNIIYVAHQIKTVCCFEELSVFTRNLTKKNTIPMKNGSLPMSMELKTKFL